jgi:alpha-galactosidase
MLDPLTGAILTPRQIKQMGMEMFEAEREYLPGFR